MLWGGNGGSRYGVKPDTAQPPLKSLQIRPEDCFPNVSGTVRAGSMCGHEDGIRRTMYYYGSLTPSAYNTSTGGSSGHFAYNYSEANKMGAPGIEGGPNWQMMEYMANSTKRLFNMPHHVTTYLALYYAARNTEAKTYRAWDWYLMRAANTTIKFGAPQVGVMDDTVFREILRAVAEEPAADPTRADFALAAKNISTNMRLRAAWFSNQSYPYGSEVNTLRNPHTAIYPPAILPTMPFLRRPAGAAGRAALLIPSGPGVVFL